ncbi:MAG: SRPBCC family protein [Verrucomicrobia bacterium]|nr:SRPBCC family protein [Verrucomicrobiota bacterium]
MNTQNTKPLRVALLGNATFSAISAVVFLFLSQYVSSFIGLSNHLILIGIGVGLGIFSVDLFHQASRRRIQTWRALYASLGDTLWVIGAIVLLVWFPETLNERGRFLLIAVSVIVGVFGSLQFWGAGEAHRLTGSKFYRHCVAVRVPVGTTKMWDVISDLSGISKYFPSLRSSIIRDDLEPQVGVTRQCEDMSGKTWAEKCTKFEAGKRIEMEFLCQEEGFPYPASEMIGGWELVEISDKATEVHVWWELRPTPSFMAPLIMPLLGLKADMDFPPLVFRMAGCEELPVNTKYLIRRIWLPTPSC